MNWLSNELKNDNILIKYSFGILELVPWLLWKQTGRAFFIGMKRDVKKNIICPYENHLFKSIHCIMINWALSLSNNPAFLLLFSFW